MLMAMKKLSPSVKLRISLRKGADGYIVAECPDVPGAISQGKNEQEAIENVQDVVSTCFGMILREWMSQAKKNMRQPRQTTRSQTLRKYDLKFVRSRAVA
jgi:predicted RNase H-like HicB family nuclease